MYRGRILRVPRSAPRAGNVPRAYGPAKPRAQTQRGSTAPAHAASLTGGNFRPPVRDQDGHPLNARPLLDITRNTDLVRHTVADAAFSRTAAALAATASERDGRFHWHDSAGTRFSYWHDAGHDRDWFGVYQGRAYFWTTFYHGRFWWREPMSGRYLVFWQDNWWWHSPDGVSYVYIDEEFYQLRPNENGVALVPLPADGAPAAGGGSEGLIVSSRPEFNYSADGSRMVQVEGEKLSAYLYAASPEERDGSKPLKFLGDGVTSVAFTDSTKGAPLNIVLSIQDPDGSIRTVVVDANGEPLSSSKPAAPVPAPPAYGTPGPPGFDAPPEDLSLADAPFPDGQ
jgi:hypothetical protein